MQLEFEMHPVVLQFPAVLHVSPVAHLVLSSELHSPLLHSLHVSPPHRFPLFVSVYSQLCPMHVGPDLQSVA